MYPHRGKKLPIYSVASKLLYQKPTPCVSLMRHAQQPHSILCHELRLGPELCDAMCIYGVVHNLMQTALRANREFAVQQAVLELLLLDQP